MTIERYSLILKHEMLWENGAVAQIDPPLMKAIDFFLENIPYGEMPKEEYVIKELFDTFKDKCLRKYGRKKPEDGQNNREAEA